MKGKKVFFLVLLCAAYIGYASDFQFYPVAREIPALTISCIAQDIYGFLWFGTNGNGLIRYTGNAHTVYTCIPFEENCLASSSVFCLVMGKNDILWAGTGSGVSAINVVTDEIRNYELDGFAVISVLSDSQDRVWAGTFSGLYVSSASGSRNFTPAGFAGEPIRFLYESPQGAIFAGTDSGLFVFDADSETFRRPDFVRPENPLFTGRITGFYADNGGLYRASVWQTGLVFTDSQSGDFSVQKLSDNRIYCLASFENFVLAGTRDGGLFSVDTVSGKIAQHYSDSVPVRLASSSVYSIFTDLNGLLWVGTKGGGLFAHDSLRSRFTMLPTKPDAISTSVLSLIQDSSGFLWSALSDGSLVRHDFENFPVAVYSSENGGLSASASLVYAGKSGVIYAGTDNGLFVYEPNGNKFLPTGANSDFNGKKKRATVRAVFEDKTGAVWIGSHDGIVRYPADGGLPQYFTADSDSSYRISDNFINFIAADSLDTVWIGTNRGLNRLNPQNGQITSYYYDSRLKEGLTHNTVLCFYEASDGTLWFGTSSGISVFDPVRQIFTASYPLSLTVTGISEPEEGVFLVGTGGGLYGLAPSFGKLSVFKIAEGSLNREFTGIPSNSADGAVYFPTTRGILCFTGVIRQNNLAEKTPRTVITDLFVNGVSVGKTQLLSGKTIPVHSDRRTVSISFTSLDFSPLAAPVYKYKLEGFDSDWISSQSLKKVQYTDLNPGFYTFKVKNEYVVYGQNSEEVAISFRIGLPVFRRWYFIVLCAILTGVLVYVVIRMHHIFVLKNRIQELEQAKNTLQNSNKNLEYLSNTDALTGIDNRRSFENVITEIWNRALAEKQLMSILMIDIDFFKSFNDKNGHAAGDAVLCSVAAALRRCLENENGIICRYGGEEFTAILLDCPQEKAAEIAECMRKEVENLAIPSARQSDSCLSVSIGVYGRLPSKETSWKLFVDNADQALYFAKQSGRNRVCVFGL